MVVEDWEECKQAVSKAMTKDIADEDCGCELLLRYSLPCKDHFLRAAIEGMPVLRSLLHPRWWVNGPPISKAFTP